MKSVTATNKVGNEPIVCTESTIEQLMDAIKNRKPISGITAIVTHPGAHIDEIFAMYLQAKTPEGLKLFPGIENAGYALCTQKNMGSHQGEEGFYRMLRKGYFIIGTGGGPFDEHGNRATQKSCAQIMADYLDAKGTPEGRIVYHSFMNYVNFEDGNGNGLKTHCKDPQFASTISPALIADNIKKGWKLVNAGLKTGETLLAEVTGFIQNEIESQRLFAKSITMYQNASKETIELPHLPQNGNKKPVLLIVYSDEDVVGAAKNQFSKDQTRQIKVLVKINTKGQFYMCPMNGSTLIGVVKLLRIMLRRNRKLDPMSHTMLGNDGKLPGTEEIHYQAGTADSILNGSLTQPDVPGLVDQENGLSKAELIKAIIDGVQIRKVEPSTKK